MSSETKVSIPLANKVKYERALSFNALGNFKDYTNFWRQKKSHAFRKRKGSEFKTIIDISVWRLQLESFVFTLFPC